MNNLLILLQAAVLGAAGTACLAWPDRIRQAGLDYYSRNPEGPYRAQVKPWLEGEKCVLHMRIGGAVAAAAAVLLLLVLIVL